MRIQEMTRSTRSYQSQQHTTNQCVNCQQERAATVTAVSQNRKTSFDAQVTAHLQKSAKNGADFAAAHGHYAFLLPEDDDSATDPLTSGPPMGSLQTILLPLLIGSLDGPPTASPATPPGHRMSHGQKYLQRRCV